MLALQLCNMGSALDLMVPVQAMSLHTFWKGPVSCCMLVGLPGNENGVTCMRASTMGVWDFVIVLHGILHGS